MQQLLESNNQLKIFVANELKNTGNEIISSRQIEAIAAYLVRSAGIRANLKGYSYLVKVITYGVIEPGLLHPISKGAYRVVSEVFGVNVSCIERRIRSAIDSAYTHSPEQLRKIILYPGTKPYALGFIAISVDIIRNEIPDSAKLTLSKAVQNSENMVK